MNGLSSVSLTLCYTGVAVGMISVLIPQKRTRRIMSFVIGLFIISVFISAAAAQISEQELSVPSVDEVPIPTYSEADCQDTVAQMTADRLTQALNELLQNEGIKPVDIQLSLKISDEGRISVVRAVIYINESDSGKAALIKSVVYRNISKEPEINVAGKEAQQMAE